MVAGQNEGFFLAPNLTKRLVTSYPNHSEYLFSVTLVSMPTYMHLDHSTDYVYLLLVQVSDNSVQRWVLFNEVQHIICIFFLHYLDFANIIYSLKTFKGVYSEVFIFNFFLIIIHLLPWIQKSFPWESYKLSTSTNSASSLTEC